MTKAAQLDFSQRKTKVCLKMTKGGLLSRRLWLYQAAASIINGQVLTSIIPIVLKLNLT